MNIALIGYGKMGKEIEELALIKGHSINLIIDINNQHDLIPENFRNIDVAIEFTTPQTAVRNIMFCIDSGIPVVSGTTGWHEHLSEVKKKCMEKNGSLFYSSNFSPGVNVMFAVNEFLAKIMDSFTEYNVEITEIHHTRKLDAPSGTAINLAEQIINYNQHKKSWALKDNASGEILEIKAIRENDIKGIHEVIYESEIDTISLKHAAKSRKGLAGGALMAAEFIFDHKGIYTMRDLMGI